MKWLKRLLYLLTSLLLSSALIVTVLMLYLDESGHKRLLVWAAKQFLDSELIIEGALELDVGRNLSLATEDVRLAASDGSFTLTLGELKTSFRLGSYLRTGTFWFNSLELHEVDLNVEKTSNNRSAPGYFKLPPVVIARARFKSLTLSYRGQPPGTLHQFSLEELIIEEAGRGQPVSLYANGLFQGQPFVLEGTSDSIAELLETPEPKNVQLSLSGEQGKILAQGTIADPVNGCGLDLLVQADVPQINNLVDIFWNEIPVLGSLQGSLKLRGDYQAPRLEAIELQLTRDQEVELNVQGAVADAHSGRGLDLQFDGRSSNPKVLSWLVFKKLDGMQTLEITGSLKGDIDQPALHDLDAFAETADGLRLRLGGSALLRRAGYRLAPADADLTIEISAPTLAASKLSGLKAIPVSGPVSAKAQLALGRDALGIYQADVTIGDRNDGRIQLNGDVGHVPFAATLALPGLKLLTDIQYAEFARLGEQLDYPLPALGQARLRGTLVSRGSKLVLQGAKLDIGTADQSILQATGMLTAPLDDPGQLQATMDVTIQAPELAMLGKPFEVKLPELGQTRITGRLEANRSGWKFSNARLAVGDVDEPTIHAKGGATTDVKTGSTIDVALNMGVNRLVTAYTELPAPTADLGRLDGDAVITNRDGSWGIKQFKLRSTGTSLYRLNLDGSYKDLVNYDDARMNTRLVVRNPDKLGKALGIHLPSMGVYRMQGLLSLNGGRLRYEGEAKVGKSKSITTIDGRLKGSKPVLSGNVEIPVLYLTDFGIRPSSDPIPLISDQAKTSSQQVFSRKPVDIGFLHHFDLDMTLSIDIVESGELAINSVSSRLQLRDGQLEHQAIAAAVRGRQCRYRPGNQRYPRTRIPAGGRSR